MPRTAIRDALDRFADLFEESVEVMKERDRLMRNPRVQRFIEVEARWRKLLDDANGAASVLGHLVGDEHRTKRASERHKAKTAARRRAKAH